MASPGKKRQNTTASARLRQDYVRIKKDPVPYIIGAEPLPSNILEWHYVVKGPESSLYENGYYHGKLVFPKEFPFKPPKIIMLTPNGRFKTHTRLCLSISDFHPDTWNPAWSVSTILTGLLSFMLEKSPTLGSIETTDYQKKQFARKSWEFNLKDEVFCELFPEIREEICELLRKRRLAEDDTENDVNKVTSPVDEVQSDTLFNNNNGGMLTNMCVFVGFAVFAVAVNYVLKAVSPEEMGG